MSQESKEQTSSIIVCMFDFGFRIYPACMHVCWEFGKKAVCFTGWEEATKAGLLLFYTLVFLTTKSFFSEHHLQINT